MRPYIKDEVLNNVSISLPDIKNGSPKEGDMIARNPKNHEYQWLVAKAYFDDNLEPIIKDPEDKEETEYEVQDRIDGGL